MLTLPFKTYPVFGRDNPEYAYACGRISVLETKLLDRTRIERLASAKDIEEVFKLLQDTDYSRYLNEIHSPGDFEIMLKKDYERLLKTLSELSVEPELERDLRLYHDFLNVKILLKSIIFEKDFSSYFSKFSYYPVSYLKYFLESGKGGEDIVDRIPKAYENAISAYYEKKEIFRIEAEVDKEMYRYYAMDSKYDFLRIYYKINTDVTNLLTFLRLERLGKPQIFKYFYLDVGYLPSEIFEKSVDFASLLHEIRHTVYHSIFYQGFNFYLKNGSFVRVEKDIKTYLNGLVREASKKDLGVEPIFSYYFRKKGEISLLRMIMVSKLNGLTKELILERVPEVL